MIRDLFEVVVEFGDGHFVIPLDFNIDFVKEIRTVRDMTRRTASRQKQDRSNDWK